MYLAGILGLCALLLSPVSGNDGSRAFLPRDQQASPAPQTAGQATTQGQTESIQPVEQTSPAQGTTAAKKPKSTKKKPSHKKSGSAKSGSAANQDSKKTVIRKGGTGDTTVQLTPAVNEADASRERETTKQLLTSTDANLQKLSGRQLSKDQQDTIAQIREFMQQAKTADSKGDLERASKLAAKAHLLSEALANP
jgi:hypothetical protein